MNSGWCKEEFSLAHVETVGGREKFIIFVMVDDTKVDDLPKVMKSFVKTRTYIDATDINNQKDLDLFRKKLQYSMPQTPLNNIPKAMVGSAKRKKTKVRLKFRRNRRKRYYYSEQVEEGENEKEQETAV